MRMTEPPPPQETTVFEEIAKRLEAALLCLDEGNTDRAGVLVQTLLSEMRQK